MKVRLLSRDDVRRALSMPRAIALMEEAFQALSSGEVQAPARTNISHDSGTMLYKPSFMPSAKLFGLKAVSVFPANAVRGLPVTTGLMLINDSQTGLPLALMDAESLTAIRTGAATGLATRMFANPDAKAAALFGAGGQAACQLEALLAVLPLEVVYVFSRTQERAESFCAARSPAHPHCRLIPAQSREVLKQCGVIATATTSASPVFSDGQLPSGAHINGMGSFTATAAEVPPETVRRAAVFVDHREAALREAGDLVQPLQAGLLPTTFQPAEIGEVLLGLRPGRADADQVTFFKSVGNAAQDIVCAAEILRFARNEGGGHVFDFDPSA